MNSAHAENLIGDVFAKFLHLLLKNLHIKQKKIRRKDNNFSKRLNYANEKIRKMKKFLTKRKNKTIDDIADSFRFQGVKQEWNVFKLLAVFMTKWLMTYLRQFGQVYFEEDFFLYKCSKLGYDYAWNFINIEIVFGQQDKSNIKK